MENVIIYAVTIDSEHIGMEFVVEKCAMLIMKNGKQQIAEGIELPNPEKIRTLGEMKTYKYLRIFKADTIKYVETKEKRGIPGKR